MRTWTLRLALGWMAVVGFVPARLAAQELIPSAPQILVVPAVSYEPGHPTPNRPSPITTVDFREGIPARSPIPAVDFQPPAGAEPLRFWARSEYLHWRVTGAPIAAPIVTGGPASGIGAIGEPGTTILFGTGSGQDANFGPFSGVRLAIGGWLEEDYEFSWECTGFLLERRTHLFRADSAGGGATIVAIPFRATEPFNAVNPAGETSVNSGSAPSSALVNLSSQLWGAEANQLVNLWTTERFYWAAILGFRYVGLSENFALDYTSFDTFNGGTAAVADRFSATNHFYAGQIGARIGLTHERWNLDAAAKVALGSNFQSVNIEGNTTVSGGAFGFADGTTAGGVFAQPSNIDRASRNVFMVAPEFQIKAAYELTPRLRAHVGYNALYLSNVVRPGNHLDRNINPTQNAFFVPPGTLTGTPAPLATIRESSFWAHGLQVGMELRY